MKLYWCVLLATSTIVAHAAAPSGERPPARTTAVECDRLATARYARDSLAKPVERENIDVPAAIRQCEADLARMPGDPRIHFHLGRLYGYAGDSAKAMMHRRKAASLGDTNAMQVVGYLDFEAAKTSEDRCAAARLIRESADLGNYAGMVTYPAYALDGRLKDCSDNASHEKMVEYLKTAKPQVDGYFEILLVDHMLRQLNAAR